MEQWEPEPFLVLGAVVAAAAVLPIPWHVGAHPKRAHPRSWKQHLMGQEVRREHTCFPPASPTSPQLLANAGPASALLGAPAPTPGRLQAGH